MVEGDVFREVEEELRKERAKEFWDRYGMIIIACALGIILGVSGFKGWQYYTAQQAAAAGSRFERALVLQEEGKTDEAHKALTALVNDGPQGYQSLALFRLAGELAESGKTAEAVSAYDNLADAKGGDVSLARYARVRAAMLRVDDASLEEMHKRLDQLTNGETAWRHTARELLGLAAYKNGKRAEAEKIYQEILTDSGVTRGLRQRAQVMLALLFEPGSAGNSANAEKADKKTSEDDSAPEIQN